MFTKAATASSGLHSQLKVLGMNGAICLQDIRSGSDSYEARPTSECIANSFLHHYLSRIDPQETHCPRAVMEFKRCTKNTAPPQVFVPNYTGRRGRG
ncbi:hypothetical protein E2C01_052635 [Portunus trituberculatus]|uniref:Uncharacterized protein n=1 Tax=Portunus trituberculatus TaxID=210409 RepID=A0A5B7GN12_PORTR|nr:hypothetical protein [Portunus trituberculatus]